MRLAIEGFGACAVAAILLCLSLPNVQRFITSTTGVSLTSPGEFLLSSTVTFSRRITGKAFTQVLTASATENSGATPENVQKDSNGLLKRDITNGIYPGKPIYHPVVFFIRHFFETALEFLILYSIEASFNWRPGCLIFHFREFKEESRAEIYLKWLPKFEMIRFLFCITLGYYGPVYEDEMFEPLDYDKCSNEELIIDVQVKMTALTSANATIVPWIHTMKNSTSPLSKSVEDSLEKLLQNAKAKVKRLKAAFKAAEKRGLMDDNMKTLHSTFKEVKDNIQKAKKQFKKVKSSSSRSLVSSDGQFDVDFVGEELEESMEEMDDDGEKTRQRDETVAEDNQEDPLDSEELVMKAKSSAALLYSSLGLAVFALAI